MAKAESYRHEEEALLRPDVGTQAQFTKRKPPKTYRYDSSLSPALDWDGQSPAREFGEWLLLICQCLEGTAQPVYCRAEEVGVDPDARALEREANIFAANLVMPEAAVRGAAGENRFGVSDEALAWPLYNLGLVEERPR